VDLQTAGVVRCGSANCGSGQVWICKGPRGCSTISATYVAKAAAGAGTVEVEDSAAVTAAEEGKGGAAAAREAEALRTPPQRAAVSVANTPHREKPCHSCEHPHREKPCHSCEHPHREQPCPVANTPHTEQPCPSCEHPAHRAAVSQLRTPRTQSSRVTVANTPRTQSSRVSCECAATLSQKRIDAGAETRAHPASCPLPWVSFRARGGCPNPNPFAGVTHPQS
jgi:hypothetical protein